MGQYYLIVNKTKKEYLYPHVFNDGLKALEILWNANTLKGLGLLLLKSDGGGGGDLKSQRDENNPLIGRWAGDDITIVGDYDSSGLYEEADQNYTDISWHVFKLLLKEGVITPPEPGTYHAENMARYKKDAKPLPVINKVPVKEKAMFIEPEEA